MAKAKAVREVEEVVEVEEVEDETAAPDSNRDTVNVLWSRLRDEEVGSEPSKQHMSDVGYDLACSRYIQIAPHSRAQVPTNTMVAIPDTHFGLVLPRSSTFHKRGLIGHIGVLDPGFRGEVMFVVYNPGMKQVHVGDKERLAQLVLLPAVDIVFTEVRGAKKMPKGDRGDRGFGSTGGFEGQE